MCVYVKVTIEKRMRVAIVRKKDQLYRSVQFVLCMNFYGSFPQACICITVNIRS